MKQTRSAVFAVLLSIAVVGSFLFGRYVSTSANMPLRAAHLLVSQEASRSNWQVEAQNSPVGHDLAVPVSYPAGREVAQNTIGSDSTPSNDSLFSSDSPLVTFQQVYDLLKQNFVDRIDNDTPLAHGAVSAMVAALDEPNSRFLEPTDRSDLDNEAKGQYSGIGVVFTVRKEIVDGLIERQLTIIDPITGSPAEKAGLKTGDVVTDIDGHWVISYDPFEAQSKMFKSLSSDPVSFNHAVDAVDAKIKAGYDLSKAQAILTETSADPLQLGILRSGKAFTVSVAAGAPTQVTDVTSKRLDDGNGYIQVNAFTETTAQDFETAFAAVSSAPGIVVDLRGCPGGVADSALQLAQALSPNSSLGTVTIRNSGGQLDKIYGIRTGTEDLSTTAGSLTPVSPITYSGHISVLVNEGTANVAELFAAFLRDHLGARIVGDSTFGDGMEQTMFPMGDGSAFILTTGIIKTCTDQIFEAKGITPDISLAQVDADSSVALRQAEDALQLKPLSASSVTSTDGQQKS